tara:strand:- start:130 stop:972 length:843 start_codon:yes stop_codon:yes gene_type:complete
MQKKIRIAIVGSTSFIGQKFLSYINKKKFIVVATYRTKKNINKKYNFKWKKLDINEKKKDYFKYLENPDIVINFLWDDIPHYYLKSHIKTYKIQKKFISNLIKKGLKNIIVLGTCYEYGKVSGKLSENTKEKPIIPYAIAKLKLLKSIKHLKKNYNFKFSWLRPFFVYGNNKKRKNLFSLINDLEKGKIKKLKVCGNLKRDFISVKYLCYCILKIIFLNKNIGILNISSGTGITLKKFVLKNIKNKKNIKKIEMNGINPNKFEPNSFWGNNSKLKNILQT